jgi:hypothetical protein
MVEFSDSGAVAYRQSARRAVFSLPASTALMGTMNLAEPISNPQAALMGMQEALSLLRSQGELDESGPVASFSERQRLVRRPEFEELERRYARGFKP